MDIKGIHKNVEKDAVANMLAGAGLQLKNGNRRFEPNEAQIRKVEEVVQSGLRCKKVSDPWT